MLSPLSVMSFLAFAVCVAGVLLRSVRRAGTARAVVREMVSRYYPGDAPSPIILERRAFRRMLEHVSIGVSGEALVPTSFTVLVGSDDFETLRPIQSWFCSDLSMTFVAYARAHEWPTPSTVLVELAADDGRPMGAPIALPSFTPATVMKDPSGVRKGVDLPTQLDDLAQLEGAIGAYDVRGGSTLGRAGTNTIVIGDPDISRWHCRVAAEDGRWLAEDLGSLNGTFVNAVRIVEPTRLNDGDELRLGSTVKFRFSLAAVSSERLLGGRK